MSARLSLIVLALVACRGNDKPAPSATGSARATNSTAPRPTLPESAARTPQEREAIAEVISDRDGAFLAEPVDATWAEKTAASIKTRAQWSDVECRSTQCRVVFVAPSGEDPTIKSDTLRALTRENSDEPLAQWMPMPPINLPDGSVEVRLYATITR